MCGMKKYFICEAGMGQRPQTSAEHLASQRSNEAAAEAESVDYVEACHNSTIIYLLFTFPLWKRLGLEGT